MQTTSLSAARVLALVLSLAFAAGARADLIANGGFEMGLAGWTVADQPGSDGTFTVQSGTTSPVNGEPVPAPPEGDNAAMTDAQAPGSHLLYQSFVVPAPVTSLVLRFDLFVGNRADAFYAPDTLDFATPALNQQARVDLMLGSADPFSLAAGDVLQTLFRTLPGDPLVSGYTSYAVDISAVANANVGVPIRLRFAEVDNVLFFQLGVDNVRFDTGAVVAEPPGAALALAALALAAWAGFARSKRARHAPMVAPRTAGG